MKRGLNLAVSQQLRERLGVTVGSKASTVLATAAEMRALRASLQMTRQQMATYLSINRDTVMLAEEQGMTAQRMVYSKAGQTKLAHSLMVARGLGALAFDPGLKRAKRYERPPVDLEYKCKVCGKDLAANRVRKIGDEWMHGRGPCGPVIPGGPTHAARVAAMKQAQHA